MHIPHPREIRAARLEIDMSRKEAADLVGVTESTWQGWETDPQERIYEVISSKAWNLFLRRTKDLRPRGSGFVFDRKNPYSSGS
jgi:hypothetical protein